MASITASAVSLQTIRAPTAARRASFSGAAVRSKTVTHKPSLRVAPTAAWKSDESETSKAMNPGFNFALAAVVAGSVFTMDAISPEWAEAGRSGGRMGGSSFRSAPRGAPRGMGGQSRQAPSPQAMRGGMGYGSFMPFPMFSPFGFSPFGFGFGMGGFGFIFQIFALLWIVNFVSSLLASAQQHPPGNDDDDMPPRY